MSKVSVTKDKLDILANAIANKSGEPLTLTLDEMVSAVDGIENNPAPTLQAKTYTVDSAGTETITADSGYDGLSSVAVNVPAADPYFGAESGFYTDNNVRKWRFRGKTAVYNDDGYSEGYIGQGDYYGTWQVRNAVPSNTTITPTESSQTIGGTNYMMEGAVTVSAIPSNYVGSGITQRSSSDLTVSGATVTAPSGYYSASASKSVASGTAGTPTATKGTVSNHSVSVTPSVTNTTGYITGSTKTGTAVTVSASELVSGTKSITQNGTGIDVTAFASIDVNVPSSGVDTVVISYTYNDQTETIGTISCNKTYAECLALLNDGKSEAIIRSTETVFDETYETGATGVIDTNVIIYTEIQMGVPRAEYRYSSNGTITIADPSSVTHLTATQNGDYYPDGVYGSVTVNVSSGGMKLGYSTATPENGNKIVFTGIKGAPTSLCITSDNNISTSTPPNISTILFDGTTFEGIGIGTESNAQVSPLSSGAFIPTYDDGDQTVMINTSGCQFVTTNTYSLVYTYGGSASNIDTKEVQVGSGATSITFTGLEAEPDYFSCVFESSFGTSSGYQRVITVVNDGSDTYGLAMDSSAKAQTSWTYSYSNGSLTITSQSTNNGGYFHQPGNYQLTYGYGGEVPHYQSKTVTPTTSQQVVTADSGYDALRQVTVNAMPSMTLPSSTSATSSGTSKATISASSSTQYLNIPTGYNDTAQYYTISASGGGSSKNAQTVQGTSRTSSATLTAIGAEMTVLKTGTYDVYWSATRSNTSSQYTFGTQLYIDGTAYGSEQTGSWFNNIQNIHLSNVSLTANQTIRVYGRESRGTSYYIYCGQLTIIEA